MRAVLVHMPWGALERPALGLSLLAAGISGRPGVEVEVRYLNMPLADAIGADCYQWITHDLPHIAFAGEWLFTEALFGPDARRDTQYVNEILRREWQLPDAHVNTLLRVRTYIEPYFARVLGELAWSETDLVGFTSTFEQNVASLALARRLKERYPKVVTAFGGANWESVMGQEYHRVLPFVDLCCSGEADDSFPQIIDALRAPARERTRRLRGIPGVVFRDRGESVATGPGTPVEKMDTLPVPAFDGYFSARESSTAAADVAPALLFETSRGCWWGAKSHCTFCGLNGHSMSYRSKSPKRVVEEVGELVRRWPCPSLEAVDNILDMHYFDTVLPAFERIDFPGPVFFEVKANMKRHHVAALRKANILRIQPGIESLSDHVLQLMRKGTTALRNVQLLKWCREYEISVDWNLLYGFPGETDDDYREIMSLLPRIRHLQLPGACGPIRLDRFSPYFERAEQFGIANVRPLPVYRLIYPVQDLRHERVAYYFKFDYRQGTGPSPLALDAAALAASLRDSYGGGRLQAMPCRDGGLHISDTRPNARATSLRLSPYERCIIERMDEVTSLPQIVEVLERSFPRMAFSQDNVQRFIEELVSLDMALSDKSGHYLGLALMTESMRPALEQSSKRVAARSRTIPIAAASNSPVHA
jgi:ribosomal peptide maturation radical SAM protein 1